MVHTPVLVREVVQLLVLKPSDVILDGTVGTGGHAERLLEEAGQGAILIGIDRDPNALAIATERLQPFGDRVHLLKGSYRDAEAMCTEHLPGLTVTKIVLDLGVSSLELEASGRGFSFQHDDEPLDMRFDPSDRMTAADLLNSLPERDLAHCMMDNGEDPLGRRIARAIILRRKTQPYERVRDLVQTVLHVYGARAVHSRIHPATRTFQALRIAVNDELCHLDEAMPRLIAMLAPGGRIAVISFHSIEDRIVKRWLKRESTDCLCPPEFPECRCNHHATLALITKHVVTASSDERTNNPRARSAKLRVAEKHTFV